MSLAVIPSTFLLPPEKVSLGDLTTKIAEIQEEQFQPSVTGHPQPLISEFEFTEHNVGGKQTRFQAAISSLISVNLFRNSTHKFFIAGGMAKSYSLSKVGTWFKKALELDETKRWIQERAAAKEKIYMVVGFKTLVDPLIGVHHGNAGEVGADLSLPTDLLPNVGLSQVGVLASHKTAASKGLAFKAAGERIYAVNYRKITFKWCKRQVATDVPQLSTDTYSWNCLSNPWRGAEDALDDSDSQSESSCSDDGLGDAIEVALEMETSMPDHDWTKDGIEEYYHIGASA
ncbi:hypothetical protein PWT90_00563 [Aphanocladium album]|nr:hypothetical protein PWT90_00563 [Aphanocladium album]